MRRFTVLAALVAAAAAILVVGTACRTTVTPKRLKQVNDGKLMERELASYHLVYSEYQGKVGYMKVYNVRQAGGPAYRWKYVLDLDLNELGFIDQYGSAHRYYHYTGAEAKAHRDTMRVESMPADSTERNVMRMLGIDPALDNVSFPIAPKFSASGG